MRRLPIPTRRLAATGAALIAAFALAGCGSRDSATVQVVVIDDVAAPFGSRARLSTAAGAVRAATTEGLVAFDAQGRIVPALADRWIVTDDGRSYIFRLRDGTWPDGSPITGESARTALRRALAGLRGTPLALDLAGTDDIRVMAGRVIEIRLPRAMPDLLQLLGQPELGLVWRGKGSGPMRLSRDGAAAVLTPIAPEKRGLPAVAGWEAATVRLAALPAAQAVARFNAGDADVLLGGQIQDFPLARSVGLIRGGIQPDPVAGLFGLAVLHDDGFLALPENREAIAMAIDRAALIAPFGLSGWQATTRMVAPGTTDDDGTVGERWAGLSMAERRSEAARRIARWRDRSQREGPVQVRIALPPGPGADVLFERLADDLRQIGIEARRTRAGADADLRLVDVVARYPGRAWYLNQLSCVARRGLCSADADAEVSAARAAPDRAQAIALLADAEATLTKANVFIPFGAPLRWSLVRGSARGFAANHWAIHPLMPMATPPN